MVVWKLIVYHQINVSATETSFKMDVNALSKMGLKKSIVLSKSSKFCTFRTIRFCSNFASMWFKYVSNNVWRGFYTAPVSAFTTVARKVLMANLLPKWFSDWAFNVTITDADIWSQKSLHTLFGKYLKSEVSPCIIW